MSTNNDFITWFQQQQQQQQQQQILTSNFVEEQQLLQEQSRVPSSEPRRCPDKDPRPNIDIDSSAASSEPRHCQDNSQSNSIELIGVLIFNFNVLLLFTFQVNILTQVVS